MRPEIVFSHFWNFVLGQVMGGQVMASQVMTTIIMVVNFIQTIYHIVNHLRRRHHHHLEAMAGFIIIITIISRTIGHHTIHLVIRMTTDYQDVLELAGQEEEEAVEGLPAVQHHIHRQGPPQSAITITGNKNMEETLERDLRRQPGSGTTIRTDMATEEDMSMA